MQGLRFTAFSFSAGYEVFDSPSVALAVTCHMYMSHVTLGLSVKIIAGMPVTNKKKLQDA